MKFLKGNALSFLLFAAMAAVSAKYYPMLPALVPTKFDLLGNPINYSSKEFVALFMPGFFLFMVFFIGAIVAVSPEKFSMLNSRNAMYKIVFGMGLLFAAIHVAFFMGFAQMPRLFSIGIGLFLIVGGNVMGKTERNFLIGIRIPWTIASAQNWKMTHRFAGKLMVSAGLLLLIMAFVHPSMILALVAAILPSFAPVLYSYIYFQRHERHQSSPV